MAETLINSSFFDKGIFHVLQDALQNDPLRDFMDIVRWYGHDEIRAMKTTDGMFHGQTDTNTLLL